MQVIHQLKVPIKGFQNDIPESQVNPGLSCSGHSLKKGIVIENIFNWHFLGYPYQGSYHEIELKQGTYFHTYLKIRIRIRHCGNDENCNTLLQLNISMSHQSIIVK